MTRRACAAALLTAAFVTAGAGTAFSHPGHSHTILGTISMVDDGHIEVLDKSNEKTLFAITKDTKILVGKSPGTRKDLHVGSRIVVEAEEEEDETFIAVKIQLPARAAK